MNATRPSAQEIGRRGQAIYESSIRPLVEREHVGKYLVIDIETGEYDIDEDRMAVSERAVARWPQGLRYLMRIGYRAVGRIGARLSAARP